MRDGAAVVCTTAHPEQVAPALRGPGGSTTSWPSRCPTGRAAGAARGAAPAAPLADDVHLDEVAAHTPGFVAADLLALVREAAVRAAPRQRDVRHPTIGAADFTAALEVVRPTSLAEPLDVAA